jgi:hypothetical protein
MCVLSSNIVDDILNKNNVSHHGFKNMHVTNEMQNLSLLFHMCVNSQSFMNKDFFIMGNLEKRLPKKKTFHETYKSIQWITR